MKKMISLVAALALVSVAAFAQPAQKGGKNKDQWQEKVRAEQIAMITHELDLSEAEAQAFWPVYNDVQKQKQEAFQHSKDAFRALRKGLDGDNVNELLKNYLDAKKAAEKVNEAAVERYKKVLPINKVAKLVISEEKFRHQQIGKLGGGKGVPGKGGHGKGGHGNHGQFEDFE